MIVGLAGYAGVGKDTIACTIQYILACDVNGMTIEDVLEKKDTHQWWLEIKSGWRTKSYAEKLKQVASLVTGVPIYKFNDHEFKKSNLGKEWGFMSVREFLQRLGTDAMRKGLYDSVWINALMSGYTPSDKWLITDVRFPDEAQAIKDRGGVIVRVNRPNVGPTNNHISELAMDHWKYDETITNRDGMAELLINAGELIKNLRLDENNKTKH